MFQFNVQHDCHYAQCKGSGECPVMQEQTESGLSENFIVHTVVDRYVMSTHGQHNIHLIHAALPRNLTAPIPFVVNRQAHHSEFSTDYHTSQSSKRAAAAEKAAEKKNLVGSQPGPSRKRKRVEDLYHGSTPM
jgi:hypothetical protein